MHRGGRMERGLYWGFGTFTMKRKGAIWALAESKGTGTSEGHSVWASKTGSDFYVILYIINKMAADVPQWRLLGGGGVLEKRKLNRLNRWG